MSVRKRVITKSPVRENRTQGSVGGSPSNGRSYPYKKSFGDISLKFAKSAGGFPSEIQLAGRSGINRIVKTEAAWLSCSLGDGRKAQPFLPENFEIFYSTFETAERIEFRKIPWRDQNGKILEDFYLSLRYELWSDGTCFVNSYFFVENTNAPDIVDFSMEFDLDFDDSESLRWGCMPRPSSHDGTMIQSAKPLRFQKPGKEFSEDGIMSQFSFDCTRKQKEATHLEFFVEGQNSLSSNPDETRTELLWKDDKATIRWNFQTKQCDCHDRPWQWRNQWGWLIKNAPTKRHLPPLRMYHYFDNYKRYPSNRQIDKMAEAGADVLAMHENWRLDPQNGGIPYDSTEFSRVVEHAHERGIRIAPYIRGNETSAAEEYCDWFDAMLDKDFDGLYMDYGGPLFGGSMADESYHAGRIHFRAHYLKMRKLREQIGDDGVFFSHTGPLFSALGMTDGIVDGYTSGEGEGGIMIKDRENHQYFSSAFAADGSMWTAAFPGYSTKQMIPFLASSGQVTHTPVGTQFVSCSLSHPGEPGISDVYLRALWRLWGIVKDYRDFDIYNDYNCSDIFSRKTPDTGVYLLVKDDIALLLLTNFSQESEKLDVNVNWNKTGFTPKNGWALSPTNEDPGFPEKITDLSSLSANVDDCGVMGFLLTGNEQTGLALLKDYSSPYPLADDTDAEYQKSVEEERLKRFSPAKSTKAYLRLSVPNLSVPYEESMWWDLFENAMQLSYLDGDDNFIELGWVSKNGLVKDKPDNKDYIWPSHSSPWLALHDILPEGKHHLRIQSIHLGEPFYSFIELTLSSSQDENDKNAYNLRFFNEIDDDRSCIKFNVDIA